MAAAQQLGAGRAVVGEAGHPDAQADRRDVIGQGPGRAGQDTPRDRHAGRAGGQDRELIAPEPRDRVHQAHRLGQGRGDLAQDVVGHVGAALAIDRRQAVDVEDGQADRRALAARPHQLELEHPFERAAVGEPGERIRLASRSNQSERSTRACSSRAWRITAAARSPTAPRAARGAPASPGSVVKPAVRRPSTCCVPSAASVTRGTWARALMVPPVAGRSIVMAVVTVTMAAWRARTAHPTASSSPPSPTASGSSVEMAPGPRPQVPPARSWAASPSRR